MNWLLGSLTCSLDQTTKANSFIFWLEFKLD